MEPEELERRNPWWRRVEAIEEDFHVVEYESHEPKWDPMVRRSLRFDVDRVFTLRGPRQVGKTTLLKLLLREALASGAHPRSVLYLSCDLLHDPGDIVAAVNAYLDSSRGVPEGEHRLILLDEVTSVRDWDRGVKSLVDQGALVGSTVVLTGSHAMDLRRSSGRLAGRRGEGEIPLNVTMRPLRFSEYVATVSPPLLSELEDVLQDGMTTRREVLMRLLEGELPDALGGPVHALRGDLRGVLDEYMVTGGMMRAVRQLGESDSIAPGTYELYVRGLLGDLARWGMSEGPARQVIAAVSERLTSSFSLNSIAKATELGSHSTVGRYLDALEEAFVLANLFQLELHRGRAKYKAERKVHFADPFMAHAFSAWVLGEADPFSSSRTRLSSKDWKAALVEGVVAAHMARLMEDLASSDLHNPREALFFWKKKGSGREVDLVARVPSGFRPVEVKYQTRVTSGDMVPLKSFKGGLVVSRDTLEARSGRAIVPLEVFLVLV